MTPTESSDLHARSGIRVAVTAGGHPDPQEIAALVVALGNAARTPPPTGTPAWREGALLEGLGGCRVVEPSDLAFGLRVPRRS